MEQGLEKKQRIQELHAHSCQRLKTKFFKNCYIIVEINPFYKKDSSNPFSKEKTKLPAGVSFKEKDEILFRGMKYSPIKDNSNSFIISGNKKDSLSKQGFSFSNVIEAYNFLRKNKEIIIQNEDVADIVRLDSDSLKDDTFLIEFRSKKVKEEKNKWNSGSFKITIKYGEFLSKENTFNSKGGFKKAFKAQREKERVLNHIDKMNKKYKK